MTETVKEGQQLLSRRIRRQPKKIDSKSAATESEASSKVQK